ncbi:hypothetical protein MINTM011_04490 [Mycobacterium paraintracellulare]|nr:hypothetical protein MINTM011_04490 [Mycobacterium paraintracellulare]
MPTVARLTTRSFALIFVLVSVSCTSPSQHAVAQPPGFPKLDEFTPVSIDNYIEIPPKGLRYAYFSTPGLLHDQVTVSVTRPGWPVWS